MFRQLAVVALCAFISGCDSVTDTVTTSDISETLAGNLRSVTYNAAAQTLTAEIYALDSTPVQVVYSRDAARDIGEYEAYSAQEDSLDRFFVAMVGESADGSVQAGFVGDGGQFNRVLQGTYYSRTGGYSPPSVGTGPAAGQVSYAGTYAGITNITATTSIPGVDPSILPGEPILVSGQIFINANFADNAVNGGIYDRSLLLPSSTLDLEDLALIITDIQSDGSFSGDVEITNQIGNDIGDYGGVFGGDSAGYVAGSIFVQDQTSLLEDEHEYGFFVLTQCGLPNDATVCDNVAP